MFIFNYGKYHPFSICLEDCALDILNIFNELPKSSFILILIMGTLVFLGILDIRKKYDNKVYNLLFILIELLLTFVFVRTLFDSSLTPSYKELRDIYANFTINTAYLFQNNIYFIIMLVPLILYRKINK